MIGFQFTLDLVGAFLNTEIYTLFNSKRFNVLNFCKPTFLNSNKKQLIYFTIFTNYMYIVILTRQRKQLYSNNKNEKLK